jgi:hypothetical protein
VRPLHAPEKAVDGRGGTRALEHVLPAIRGTGDDAVEGTHDVPHLPGFDRIDEDHPFVGDECEASFPQTPGGPGACPRRQIPLSQIIESFISQSGVHSYVDALKP